MFFYTYKEDSKLVEDAEPVTHQVCLAQRGFVAGVGKDRTMVAAAYDDGYSPQCWWGADDCFPLWELQAAPSTGRWSLLPAFLADGGGCVGGVVAAPCFHHRRCMPFCPLAAEMTGGVVRAAEFSSVWWRH